MGPTIQLIQLTLRVERENEPQRRPHSAAADDFTTATPVQPGETTAPNTSSSCRPQCECA